MEENNIPNNICGDCLQIIRTVHTLRDESIKNDIKFRNLNHQNDDAEEKVENPPKNNKINENVGENEENSNFSSFRNDNDDSDDDWKLSEAEEKTKKFQCDHCESSFQYESSLARHVREYHKNSKSQYYFKPVNCPVCGLLVPQSTNLRRHIIQYHDSSLPYGCPLCSYKFSNIPSFRHHGQKFHNNFDIVPVLDQQTDHVLIYRCDYCDDKFIEKSSLLKHMRRKHFNNKNGSKNNCICEYCDRSFTVRSNLLRHYQQAHSKQLPFQCEQCREGFIKKTLYYKHMSKIHFVDNYNLFSSTEPRVLQSNEQLICEFCSEDCGTSKYRFERHLLIFHENEMKEILKCTQCKKKFIYTESLESHTAWHERKIMEKEYTQACDMCPRRFSCAERLEKHKAGYHGGQSSLVCYICGKQMSNKSSLNFHVKRHSEKREFSCPQCPQSFVYIKELERHMTSHTDERKYICTYEGCTKRFNDLYVFQLHNKRHAGLLEKKHHCTYCDKKFDSKYTLNRHILTHTLQKPHTCTYCDMAYTQKNELVKHLRIHVGNSIYRCDFEGCNEGFRLKNDLKQHYAVHYKK